MTADPNESQRDARWERLLEREVTGELSVAERNELLAMAEHDEELRHTLMALQSISTRVPFDPELGADDANAIDAALENHRRSGRRRGVIWLAAAAIVIPLTAAAAYMRWGKSAADESENRASTAGTSSTVSRSGVPQEVPSDYAANPPATVPTTALNDRDSSGSEASSRPAPSAAAPTAAELLGRAQKARSSGEYGAAIRSYTQLLHMYPRSSEAQLARLSLAQLELARGNAAAALEGFEAYRRFGGPLTQEASYGKIQALRALGRTAEEKAESRRFLKRYPDALQAGALKRQLGASGDER